MLHRSLPLLSVLGALIAPAPALAHSAGSFDDVFAHPQQRATDGVTVSAVSPRPTGSGGALGLSYDAVVPTFFDAGPAARIWYVTSGLHAVPALDADASGVPDFVESLAAIVVSVTARYEAAGWRRPLGDAELGLPDDGGDGRFDIYLVDFYAKYQAAVTDGHLATEACLTTTPRVCTGYILIENDFAGFNYPSFEDALLTLFSHEYAHAIGAAYASGTSTWWDEGQATWAEHAFADIEHDVIRLASRWFTSPATALDMPTGPGVGWGYSGSTFLLHVSAVHGNDVLRETWEALGSGTALTAVGALDHALQQRGSSVLGAWNDFAVAAWFTGARTAFVADVAIPFASELPVISPRVIQVTALPYRHTSVKWSADYVRFEGLAGLAETLAVSPCTAEGPTQGVRLIAPGTHEVAVVEPGGAAFSPAADTVFLFTGNPRKSAEHCVVMHDSTEVVTPEPCEGDACEPEPCEGSACEPEPCEGSACEPEPCEGSACEPEPCEGSACEPIDPEIPEEKTSGCSSAAAVPSAWPLALLAMALLPSVRRGRTRRKTGG